ncbi:MAG: sulfotransferase, partial [Acidobacteria bacterium]|nr:sulfotransferase [Acidobacteriota bacterium]
EHLIFLISQPRSGSTLLQHILANHPDVHTTGEPWFMLHQLYALKRSGIETEYNAEYARVALEDFLCVLPDKVDAYIEAVRRMALHLYDCALSQKRCRYFLDKTPRYYLILPELNRVFPKAKFVLLIRNPLAVLASIINVNLAGQWQRLATPDRTHDLLSAPRLILSAIERLGLEAISVRYEELVARPQDTIRGVCHKLGIEYFDEMIHYGGKLDLPERSRDAKSIYKHERPVQDYVEDWKTSFGTPQLKHLAQAYVTSLGRHTVERLGYSYDELMDTVSLNGGPGRFHVPWSLLMRPPHERRWWETAWLHLTISLQPEGWARTVLRRARLVPRDDRARC